VGMGPAITSSDKRSLHPTHPSKGCCEDQMPAAMGALKE
jgi:hypothetical protein